MSNTIGYDLEGFANSSVTKEGTVDKKFLSSVWDSDDVSEKMADGTWIKNDVTSGANPAGVVVQGAGLEVSGHRWYVAPVVLSGVEILAVGAGGSGSHSDPPNAPGIYGVSGGNTVFTQTSTSTFILAQGGGAASVAGGGVGGAGGGAGGFVTASNLQLQKDVGYTVVIGANDATPHPPSGGLNLRTTGAPGGSGGGATHYSGPVSPGGTGNQPTIAQPFISGIPGASGFQNLGFPGTDNPSKTDYPGSDNGPGRGGGAGGSGGAAATGATSSITGTSVTYAGGGYSGDRVSQPTSPLLVNPGPGGNGAYTGNGGAGVRGGGGGGGSGFGQGGLGGPGMLIIAYPDSEPDLTITGTLSYTQPTRSGYKVYEFTSGSGTISIDT